MNRNPKIGKLNAGEYPSQTITGKPYSRDEKDPPPTIVYGLVDDWVAVGDIFAPAGFDVQAELDKLMVEVAPKVVPMKKVDKNE